MIPRIAPRPGPREAEAAFLGDLRAAGFRGDVHESDAHRTVASSDNSIWQQVPEAIVAPLDADDVRRCLSVLGAAAHRGVVAAPRGAGTSTAGQSLTSGISIDMRRHLNAIIEIDPQKRIAVVQPGVVLSTLNEALAEHQLRMGPSVATADRATIGGMIANDAAGRGSLVHGKTSDAVVELVTLLVGGDEIRTRQVAGGDLATLLAHGDRAATLHKIVREAAMGAAPHLEAHWPRLRRFLSGYNLPMAADADVMDLNRIICGSEGTLGVVVEATLRCAPLPAHRGLVIACLGDMDAALHLGAGVADASPSAVEVVDELVLAAARQDASWPDVRSVLGDGADEAGAVLLVEFAGEDAPGVSDSLDGVLARIEAADGARGRRCLDGQEQDRAWAFRSRSVGLLAAVDGDRRPVPFVEDCAVPPPALPAFIAEFRKLLDRHGLRCGMFGHVDAGVIHVRPALDLRDAADRQRVRGIADQVAALVRRHGGVLWGEHGKGFRSAFGPSVFGEAIWRELCRVKEAFDPTNQLNPGVVAAPRIDMPLATLSAPMRGEADASIVAGAMNAARLCNGNGQCQSAAADAAMCPTARVTNDSVHTPRGRSDLLRSWLQRIGPDRGGSPWLRRIGNSSRAAEDFSHEVRAALDGCLACRACATHCPVSVDVAQMRSVFYERYYGRYLRPARDLFTTRLESLLPALAASRTLEWCLARGPHARVLLRAAGIVDVPPLARPTLAQLLALRGMVVRSVRDAIGADVVVVPDRLTAAFAPRVIIALLDVAESMEMRPAIIAPLPGGKALHVRGCLDAFECIARKNAALLAPLQETAIVGIDPATTLLWRDEYQVALGRDDLPRVLLPQEWLLQHAKDLPPREGGHWRLLGHCIERALVTDADRAWKQVFEAAGLHLKCVEASCCGMGGMFGHEVEHREQSMATWEQGWARHAPAEEDTLVTGFSCASQAARSADLHLLHPLEVLAGR